MRRLGRHGQLVVALFGAAAILTAMVVAGWADAFDAMLNDAMIDAQTPWLVDVSLFFHEVGSVPIVLGVMVAGFVTFGVLDRWSTAGWWLVMVLAAIVLSEVLEDVVRRPRPGTSLIHKTSWSYPSGHAMVSGVAIAVGGAFFAARIWVRHRFVVLFLGVTFALAMAASRVYLRSHWLTDVVAGVLLGLAVVLVFVPPWSRSRTQGSTAPM